MSSHMKTKKLKKADNGVEVKSPVKATPKPSMDSVKPKVYTPKSYVDMFGVTRKGVKPKPTTFKKGGSKKK